MNEILKAHIFVLLATILVAGSFIASANLSGVIDSISLTLYRFFFALICLFPLVMIKNEYRTKILSTLPRGRLN